MERVVSHLAEYLDKESRKILVAYSLDESNPSPTLIQDMYEIGNYYDHIDEVCKIVEELIYPFLHDEPYVPTYLSRKSMYTDMYVDLQNIDINNSWNLTLPNDMFKNIEIDSIIKVLSSAKEIKEYSSLNKIQELSKEVEFVIINIDSMINIQDLIDRYKVPLSKIRYALGQIELILRGKPIMLEDGSKRVAEIGGSEHLEMLELLKSDI